MKNCHLNLFGKAATLAVAMFTCVALQADDQKNKEGKAKQSPEKFIQGALDASQLELQMASLAQERARSEQVRQLGATMAKDHQEVSRKLERMAKEKNISKTSGHQSEHQKQWEWLQSQGPGEFDKAFITHVIRDHTRDLAMLEKCSEEFATEPELKTFVDEHLPILRNHLRMAKQAGERLGVDVAAIETAAGVSGADAAGAPGGAAQGSSEKSSQKEKHGDDGKDHDHDHDEK